MLHDGLLDQLSKEKQREYLREAAREQLIFQAESGREGVVARVAGAARRLLASARRAEARPAHSAR